MLPAQWKKINGSGVVFGEGEGHEQGEQGFWLETPAAPWGDRALAGPSPTQNRGPGGLHGVSCLLRLIELESLDLSRVLWTFMLPLGFSPQPLFLKMLLWICFLSFSSNHQPCLG